MSIFGFGKKKSTEQRQGATNQPTNNKPLSDIELYGNAWRMIVGLTKKEQGLASMRELDEKDFTEATVVLAMFPKSDDERESLLKKAADAGNIEATWEYSGFLPHSYCPAPDDEEDALWEEYVLKAAEGGSVDAMNEMGNVYHRRNHYVESMYWYAMAHCHGHPAGQMSLQGIAKKWSLSGKSYDYIEGSPNFDNARHRCAIAYLELYSGMDLSVTPDETIKYVLDGTPIAAYLTADVFEQLNNYEMAYKMYNAISFENDPHGLKCYADMLFYGMGITQDKQGAIRIYEKAASLGERDAMFIMGELTKGVDKNIAAYWYGLAHTRGHQDALDRLRSIALK